MFLLFTTLGTIGERLLIRSRTGIAP